MAIETLHTFTGDEVVATELPSLLNENFTKVANNALKTVNNVAQDANNNINVTELIPKQITSDTNLNNVVTSGEYTFTKGSANITNSPTTNSFFLTVLRNDALVKQVVTEVVLDDPITYTRVLNGSSWSPWVEGGKVKTINSIQPDDSGNVDLGIIPISQGGTGATDASDACKNLGAVQTVNGKEPDAGGNVNVEEYTHPNSGVTAGTYRSVTVNAQGHVTGGSNPTLAISEGGTGANNASDACANLGAVRSVNGSNADASGNVALAKLVADTKELLAKSDGTLTWDGKEIDRINSSGDNYIRYENGIQICWNNQVNHATWWTFPMPFKVTPGAVTSHGMGSTGGVTNSAALLTEPTRCYYKDAGGGANAGHVIAIGWWK